MADKATPQTPDSGGRQYATSEAARQKLERLKSEKLFEYEADAYRFAAAWALAHGRWAEKIGAGRRTSFAQSSVDPDGTLGVAIEYLTELAGTSVHERTELLAEWGIEDLYRLYDESGAGFVAVLRKKIAENPQSGETL